MYPYSCKNQSTYATSDMMIRNQNSEIGNSDYGYINSSDSHHADTIYSVLNFTQSKLAAGNYSIDIRVNFSFIDIRDFTVTLYTPTPSIITDYQGSTA